MRLLEYLFPDATKLDVTKQYQQYWIKSRYVAGIIASIFMLSGSFVAFFYGTSGNVLNFLFGTALFVGAITLHKFTKSYRDKSQQTLTEATYNPQEINSFNVVHPVKRGVFGETTVLVVDETIIAQPAPISIRGRDATSFGSTSGGETNNQSVNTFICTNHQIICVLIGYDDAPSEIGAGFTNSMDETMRNFQFTYFHKNEWKGIVDNALNQGLPDFIEHHFSYSFPYSNISNVKAATHELLNHSLDILLLNGKTVSYTFLNPKERSSILEQLKTYVTVIDDQG